MLDAENIKSILCLEIMIYLVPIVEEKSRQNLNFCYKKRLGLPSKRLLRVLDFIKSKN